MATSKDRQEITSEDAAKLGDVFGGIEVISGDGFGPQTAEEAQCYADAAAADDRKMAFRAARQAAAGKTVAPAQARYSDDVLHDLKSMEDVARLFGGTDVVPIDVEELGSGFELIEDDRGKRQLVGVGFMIIEFVFNMGDIWVPNPDADPNLPPGVPGMGFYRQFVTMYIMCHDGRKYIVNDGGTGIFAQLRKVADKCDQIGAPYRAIMCRKGLRVSDYDYVDPGTHVKTPAATFYLDTSAKTAASR